LVEDATALECRFLMVGVARRCRRSSSAQSNEETTMDQILSGASDLIDDLQYVDDIELVNEDVVGCGGTVHDVPTDRVRTARRRVKG
jgi:hypothetical protein